MTVEAMDLALLVHEHAPDPSTIGEPLKIGKKQHYIVLRVLIIAFYLRLVSFE